MIARYPRNWLRVTGCLVLSATALVFSPPARAQTTPVPPSPGGEAAPPTSAPGTPVPPATPAQSAQSSASAQPVPIEPGQTEPGSLADEHKKKKNKKEKGEKNGEKNGGKKRGRSTGVMTAAGRIQLKGRVFALAEFEHRERPFNSSADDDVLDFSVASARVGLEYEAPVKWISAVAELELTGKPSLKDGYVQARGSHFFARMGQFKLPVSALETESPWNLPLARRGLMHDLLTDWLDVGGRRPGLMLGWRGRGGLRPRFMVGAFQGSTLSENPSNGDRNTDTLEKKSLEAQSYVARAQFEPADIVLGAWYEHRVGSPEIGQTKHYFSAGVDAALDRVLATGGIRAWAEATTGASWYEHIQKAPDDKDAVFVEARALVGYRFGGTVDEAAYLEPFGFFGVLEPDTDVRRDLAWEAAVGVNAGFWRRARLTLQAEINRAQRNFPSNLLFGVEPDRMGLLLQAGVAW